MALTLVEAAKLSTSPMLTGVIETIIYESDVLQRLPFIGINGNALAYNRENAAAAADFYNVGDTWTESTPTFTACTAVLKILGGDADVDNFIRQTRQNVQDIQATVMQLKAKAVKNAFEDGFINGSSTTNPKAFDGLATLVTGNQIVYMGADGAVLTLAKLDEMIDAVKPGKPEMLLMSKRTRRKLKTLRNAIGSVLENDVNSFGQRISFYDGIPIGISDFQSDTQTRGSSGAVCSSIYALKFGEDALAGVDNGGIQIDDLGNLETKDATRKRVKWYCGLALFSTLSASRLAGIKDS